MYEHGGSSLIDIRDMVVVILQLLYKILTDGGESLGVGFLSAVLGECL